MKRIMLLATKSSRVSICICSANSLVAVTLMLAIGFSSEQASNASKIVILRYKNHREQVAESQFFVTSTNINNDALVEFIKDENLLLEIKTEKESILKVAEDNHYVSQTFLLKRGQTYEISLNEIWIVDYFEVQNEKLQVHLTKPHTAHGKFVR